MAPAAMSLSDGKLLSRHAVERETRAHFGHSRGTLVDDDEVHDQQNAEDDEAHHDRATHHEHREALDHAAGRGGAGVTLPR